MLRFVFDVTTAKVNNDVLFTITDSRFKPYMEVAQVGNNGGTPFNVMVTTAQTVACGNLGMPAKTWYAFVVTYVSAE